MEDSTNIINHEERIDFLEASIFKGGRSDDRFE